MKMPVTAENNYNRNKNIIVFGPSGSGKSYSVARPASCCNLTATTFSAIRRANCLTPTEMFWYRKVMT